MAVASVDGVQRAKAQRPTRRLQTTERRWISAEECSLSRHLALLVRKEFSTASRDLSAQK